MLSFPNYWRISPNQSHKIYVFIKEVNKHLLLEFKFKKKNNYRKTINTSLTSNEIIKMKKSNEDNTELLNVANEIILNNTINIETTPDIYNIINNTSSNSAPNLHIGNLNYLFNNDNSYIGTIKNNNNNSFELSSSNILINSWWKKNSASRGTSFNINNQKIQINLI